MPAKYQINLLQGLDFEEIFTNLPVLYQNFHPVYYLNEFWGAAVKKRKEEKMLYFQIKNAYDASLNAQYLAKQLSRSQLDYPKSTTFKIEYKFITQGFINKSSPIMVTFDVVSKSQIMITIDDPQNWFLNIYESIEILKNPSARGERNFVDRKIEPKNFEYFYQESEEEKNFEIDQQHFSIALQGGGVKGSAYLGVDIAFKEKFGNQVHSKIKNIVGSSMGGVLGLIIACGVKQQECAELIQLLGTAPALDKTKMSEQKQMDEQRYKQILTETLVDYGMVEPELLQLIGQILSDQKIEQYIVQLLVAFNSQMAQLFMNQRKNQKLTFYRLLAGQLLSGKQSQKIGCRCLKNVFPQKNDEELMRVNFKEFYDQTGKQYTCTSVDLNDRIVRFFNHKTTPDLPVVFGMIMTSSFPVAYAAMEWRREWGKYYIYYPQTRIEKDLTGHRFTDGGMLSNFPIKLLDNQYMRSKYFSHKKNHLTKLYGFGLFQVPDKQYQAQQSKKISKISQKLVGRIKQLYVGKFRMCSLLCGVISSCCKNIFGCSKKTMNLNEQKKKISESSPSTRDLRVEDIQAQNLMQTRRRDFIDEMKQIPFIRFIFDILNTFVDSDLNFAKECFERQCYKTKFRQDKTISQKNFMNWLLPYSHEQYCKNINAIIDRTMDILSREKIKQVDIFQFARNNILLNLAYFKKKIKTYLEVLSEKHILEISRDINKILSKIYYQCINKPSKSKSLLIFQGNLESYLKQLDQMSYATFFKRQNIQKDGKRIIDIIQKCSLDFQSQKLRDEIQEIFLKIIEEQLKKSEEAVPNFLAYKQILKNQKNHQIFIPIPRQSILQWISLFTLNFILNLEEINAVKDKIASKMKVPQLFISKSTEGYRTQIRNYIYTTLHRSLFFNKLESYNNSRNIHIVLESKHVTQFYLDVYYPYIKNAVMDFNTTYNLKENQAFRIKTITASGYQSLAALLIASNLPRDKVSLYIWNIRNTIKANNNMAQQFDKKKWTRTNEKIILQIQEEVWKNRYDFLNNVKKRMQKKDLQTNYEEFEKQVELDVIQLTNTKAQLNQAFETVVDYTFEVLADLKDQDMGQFQQRLQEARNKLTSRHNSLAKVNKQSKQFYQLALNRFQDVFKYLIMVSPTIQSSIIEHSDPQDKNFRKEAWKGVILNQTLSYLKLKSLIKQALIQIGLSPDATMKQISAVVRDEDKILVNFLAIQKVKKKIIFINSETRPHMPIWAAVMASCSLPYMSQPLIDTKQWRQHQINVNMKVVEKYFAYEDQSKLEYLQSASKIGQLPLQLLTNRKIRQKIGAHFNETYLSFTFDDIVQNSKGTLVKETMDTTTIKPLDRWTIIKILGKYGNNLSHFLANQTITDRLNELGTYIQCHDNTFLDVYRSQSVQLPMKLSTLDFHRMSDPIKSKLSEVALQCVEDAKNTTLEKLNNTQGNGQRILYFRVKQYLEYQQIEKQKKQGSQKNLEEKQMKMIIQIPSAIIQDYFSMTQRFRLFFRLFNSEKQKDFQVDIQKYQKDRLYTEVKKNIIIIPQANWKQQKQLYLNLKIIYASSTAQKNSQKLPQQKNQFFQNFDYQKIRKLFEASFSQASHLSIQTQQYKIQTVYHRFNLSQLLKNKGQFFLMYCLKMNKFYGNQQTLKPIQSRCYSKEQVSKLNHAIIINSFNSQDWAQSAICENCGQCKFMIIKNAKALKNSQNNKCFSNCGRNMMLLYECQNCHKQFCTQCKFTCQFKNNLIFCPLQHEIKLSKVARFSKNNKKINICSFCQSFRAIIYRDDQCDLQVCDICLHRKSREL